MLNKRHLLYCCAAGDAPNLYTTPVSALKCQISVRFFIKSITIIGNARRNVVLVVTFRSKLLKWMLMLKH